MRILEAGGKKVTQQLRGTASRIPASCFYPLASAKKHAVTFRLFSCFALSILYECALSWTSIETIILLLRTRLVPALHNSYAVQCPVMKWATPGIAGNTDNCD